MFFKDFFEKTGPIFDTDFEKSEFEMFEEVVHNDGKSDGDII